MIALILAAAILAAVFIRWAIINDNLSALEALDDEPLAAKTSCGWSRGEWS